MWTSPRASSNAIPFNNAAGVWVNVTPNNISLDPNFGSAINGTGSNFGIETVGADSSNPGTLYFYAHNQGVWKSTDYGITWTGPISIGNNGTTVSQSGGGITVVPSGTAGTAATLWGAFIRGGTGIWKSTNGGIDWSSISDVPPLPSGRPDTYPVVVDPYNSSHVLACGHEQPFLLESTNGGASWSSLTLPTGMSPSSGTAFIFFLDTGSSTTTAKTWLWIAQTNGGLNGTWKTSDQGVTWTQVETNEHPHGACQIWQPNTTGTVFMAGVGSTNGNGIFLSSDYGSTWTKVGQTNNESVVFGSSSFVYALYGWSDQNPVNLNSQFAAMPGTGTWTAPLPNTPTSLIGATHTVATVNIAGDPIYVAAMGLGGIWRYRE